MRALWAVSLPLIILAAYACYWATSLKTWSYQSTEKNETRSVTNAETLQRKALHGENSKTGSHPPGEASEKENTAAKSQEITKVVAWWIPQFKTPHRVWRKDPEKLFRGCRHPCRALRIHERLEDADAVVMNSRNSGLLRDPIGRLPPRVKPNQIFVMYNREPPVLGATRIISKHFRDVFNLTMTYRWDSDIPIPHFKVTDHPSCPRTKDLDTGNKTKLAIWIISHCTKAGSVRWKFGEALARYMPLEIYGKCGKPCPRYPTGICLQMAERDFKFYLSFENAVCKDYATEKLQRPLMHNIVPVALGGMDFDDVIAPKAVIDIRKFKSPKLLANYLKYLDKNDTAYMEHLQWKRKLSVSTKGTGHWQCKLCDILHNSSYPYRSHFDPYQWWVEDAHCMTEKEQAAAMGVST